jgi:hypothetical protein
MRYDKISRSHNVETKKHQRQDNPSQDSRLKRQNKRHKSPDKKNHKARPALANVHERGTFHKLDWRPMAYHKTNTRQQQSQDTKGEWQVKAKG